MLKQINKLDFDGVDIYVGIDTHLKNRTISIYVGDRIFKTYSQDPCSIKLYNYLKKNFPGGLYHLAYEAGFCGFFPFCNGNNKTGCRLPWEFRRRFDRPVPLCRYKNWPIPPVWFRPEIRSPVRRVRFWRLAGSQHRPPQGPKRYSR